ncbi:MAG: AAA family ATPase, partial [Deltaproteobacteria bacterium]|nr:AAA family ATPase [Deltaproteobacteria bacterium]
HLTVLFSDLVGSTEIAAHLDAEDWREIAAQYQRTAATAVTRYGGHVAKYLGDGLMVYFGWPQAHEDDAERAVRAGLAIVDEVAALSGSLAEEHHVKLSVRVGIQTGSVVMGQGGGSQTDVFGDAPNVASRVQSATEPNSVLITAAVHDLVSGLFLVEDFGTPRLKGIEHPVRLYRAIQPTAVRRRTRGAATRALTPFVGREDDMLLLLSRWERAREGQGQLVLVMGEPGIGKSRLVEEFRARIREDPHVWVECAGEQLFQSTPFHAVTQILDQGLGWRGDESPEERVNQLELRLERAGLKVGEAVPLIAEMLSLPIPDKYAPPMLAPEQKRKRLLANLAGWVLNISRLQPMIVAMEDLHWVDPSTIELMQTLVEQVATVPLMLLYTARPEFRVPWPLRAHHAQITLSRLNECHTREMVAGVVARAALAQDLIDVVVKRTDGVPLFAEELTRLILEGEGRPQVRQIPATLHDSLAARLDRLGSAKDVAQVAAVIGREFSYEVLQAVAAIDETELHAALEKLVDAELIYARGIAPEASYKFKHALIRDAAYEALLKSRRRELHRRVARMITERFASVAEAQPEVIARHWTDAGEAEPALAAWTRAGDVSFERRAFKEAEDAYRRALEILDTLRESPERDQRELGLLDSLAQVLQFIKGWNDPESIAVADKARALAEKRNNLPQLVLQVFHKWSGVVSSGDLTAAIAFANQLLMLARREGSPAKLGLAYVTQVNARYFSGDLLGAEENFARGAAFFDPAQKEPGLPVVVYGFASHNAWMLGLADTARSRMEKQLASAFEVHSPFQIAFAQFVAAMLKLQLREHEAAKRLAEDSIGLSVQNGFPVIGDLSRMVLGRACASLGRAAEGALLIREAIDALPQTDRNGMTAFLSWLAEAEALNGALTDALATIERALEANPMERTWACDALQVCGELRNKVGQTAEAEADFRAVIAQAREIGARALELRAATSLARLLRGTGHRQEARTILADV